MILDESERPTFLFTLVTSLAGNGWSLLKDGRPGGHFLLPHFQERKRSTA
jgi:hypothetical protein